MLSRIKSSASHPATLCALLFCLCVAAAHPVLEMGINDDWSYAWSARTLAQTGHIAYIGWANAMLGWQLYWGALFIKLFGFSFLSLRLSILVVSLATTLLMQRLFVRLGISERNAAFATLTVALSPLFMPLAFSFMSDVPGVFALLLCLYLCIRALEAPSDHAAIAWLALAALTNVIGGSARQNAWLGALVIVPSTLLLMKHRRRVLLGGAVIWVIGAVLIYACLQWFSRQPFAIVEKLVANDAPGLHAALADAVTGLVKNFLALALFLLPMLIAFLQKLPLRDLRIRRWSIAIAAAAIPIVLYFALRRAPVFWLAPFSAPYVTSQGLFNTSVLLGERPEALPRIVRFLLTLLTFAGVLAALLCFHYPTSFPPRASVRPPRLSDRAVFVLLVPYTAATVLLLATRGSISDRYLLPLLPIALVPLLRFYERHIATRLPLASAVVLVAFTLFGVAGLHDIFAFGRARLAAVEELLRAGVPRTDIHAGYEYDAWTELETRGFINDKRVLRPANTYKPLPAPHVPPECIYYFSGHTPSITWRYGLAARPTACYTPAPFAPVHYATWLPPFSQAITVLDTSAAIDSRTAQ